jgi:hypothetical protein
MGAGEPDDKEKDRGPKAKGFSIFPNGNSAQCPA